MGQLTSELSREDIEVLIEAVDDWETIGNKEYYALTVVKNQPMPDEEDGQQYEFMKRLKDHFAKREKEIKDTRQVRQERCVFLKAKLMMLRQELGVGKLFAQAARPSEDVKPELEPAPAEPQTPDRLRVAEFFIRDLGVWGHYEKFLEEKGLKPATKGDQS